MAFLFTAVSQPMRTRVIEHNAISILYNVMALTIYDDMDPHSAKICLGKKRSAHSLRRRLSDLCRYPVTPLYSVRVIQYPAGWIADLLLALSNDIVIASYYNQVNL